MSLMLTEPMRIHSRTAPQSEQIALLVETFGDATQPVWIHDLADCCVYSNNAAGHRHPGSNALSFEVHDHRGAALARVITLPV